MCAKASKLYHSDLTNTDKSSIESTKKGVFGLFQFSENYYSSNKQFTLYYSPICAPAYKSYGWDLRNLAQNCPKLSNSVSTPNHSP